MIRRADAGEGAPVVLFLHGWGATEPEVYGPWLRHLAEAGNVVIYPRYQDSFAEPPAQVLGNVLVGVRTALAGIDAVCPVPLDQPLWVTSPAVVIGNLMHAARVPAAALEGNVTVSLPGLSVTPEQMLASLEHVAGREARARVRCEIDPSVARIVATWPGAIDDSRARRLGFTSDRDIDDIVRQYMFERLVKEY